MRNLKKIIPLCLFFAIPFPAHAELSCQDKGFNWSDTTPSVNLKHIFCGESHNGRNKGFHSSYLLSSSEIVSDIYHKNPLTGGIYNARVKFDNGKTKFSTFFPDHCNVASIIRSVVYAASHSTGKHRQWGILGESAPKAMIKGYCLKIDGKPFTIRMGLKGSRVNTAFPQP
ncbi:MAG: hypothetical protein GQ569_13665 [Methylococcaceae bacterium]|nr:hypothetical protein [Methylococcaceae bacterium]